MVEVVPPPSGPALPSEVEASARPAAASPWNADGTAKAPADIAYTRNIGGVPLGLKIADDIFDRGLKLGQRPTASMMPAVHVCRGAARW